MTTTNPPRKTAEKQYITITEVRRKVPVSRQCIYNWEKADLFPKRIHVVGRIFWLLSEVNDWIDEQAAKRLLSEVEAVEAAE